MIFFNIISPLIYPTRKESNMKTTKSQIKYVIDDRIGLILERNKLLVNNLKEPIVYSIPNEISVFIENNNGLFTETDLLKHKKLFKYLKKFLIKIPKNSFLYKYIGTKYEKTALYLFFNKAKNDPIEILNKAKVMIIGAGGVGSIVLQHLYAAGIKDIIVIDFDKISASNLNRQYIFDEKDIKKNKLDVIKSKFPIKSITKCINSNNDFEDIIIKHPEIDIVINCADTPQLFIDKFLLGPLLNKKPAFITCGVGFSFGTVGPLLKSKSRKQKVYNELTKITDILKYSSTCKSSFGPTNSIISDILAKEVIFYLLGLKIKSKNRRLIYNFDNLDDNK